MVSASGSVDLPRFKAHEHGFDNGQLGLINNEFLFRVFNDPSQKEVIKEMTDKWGFRSPVDLQIVLSQSIQRAVDSNEGKHMTTSMADPRKAYPRVTNPSDNPFSVIPLD